MQRSSEDIELYRDFCRRVDVPLFANDYWLDAVCPDEWDVFLIRKGDRVVAALPYHEVHRFGLRFMLQPVFTQFLGPQVDYSGIKDDEYSRRIFFRECMDELLGQIEKKKFAYCQIPMHRSCKDWLSFYWKGFRSTLKYTYVVENLSKGENIVERFSSSRRRDIKSAISKGITVSDNTLSIREFYEFHKECVGIKGEKLSYSFKQLSDIYDTMSGKNRCLILSASDKTGTVLSAVLVVFDVRSAYLLMTAVRRDRKADGAFGCLVNEAMQRCVGIVQYFDFEGSMINGVEQSYSKYGSSQKPYIYLEHYSSLAMEFLLRASGKVK